MRVIRVTQTGRYTSHGIGYTEHDGYGGTADNGWSQKQAIAYELGRNIRAGEQYQVMVNGGNKGTFTK